jgi:hypothetical protein
VTEQDTQMRVARVLPQWQWSRSFVSRAAFEQSISSISQRCAGVGSASGSGSLIHNDAVVCRLEFGRTRRVLVPLEVGDAGVSGGGSWVELDV